MRPPTIGWAAPIFLADILRWHWRPIPPILRKHDVAFAFAGADLFGFMEKELLPRLKSQTLKGSVHYLGKLTLEEVGSCLRQRNGVLRQWGQTPGV